MARRKPISPEDVIYSFEMFKTLDPGLVAYYQHVVRADKERDDTVRFQFDAPGIRQLPQVVGQLTVLPRHWWEGKNKAGKQRAISETTLEPPLGSGPCRIKAFEAGRSITYERVADYWGESLPVNIGVNNFQELRFDYFRDSSVACFPGWLDWLESRKRCQELGDRIRLSGGRREARGPPRNSPSATSGPCKHLRSTSGVPSSRTRAYGERSISLSISKRSIMSCSTASTSGSPAILTAPSWPRPDCRKDASLSSCKPSAAKCRRRSSRRQPSQCWQRSVPREFAQRHASVA